MKPLSKRYLKIKAKSQPVTHWLTTRPDKIDTEVAAISAGSDGTGGYLLLVFSLLACFMTLVFGTTPPNSGKPYPWEVVRLFLEIFGGIGVFGLLYAIVQSCRNAPKTRFAQFARRTVLERERDSEPLYQRAKLIEEAVREYTLHCDRYIAWYDVVDEEIKEPNEDLAERYHAFVVKAHGAIEKAIENFVGVVETCRRQEEFQKSHQEIAVEPTSAALSELLARLDQPVEIPQLRILDNPATSLEEEEAAAELEAFLSDKELAARIDSAASKS